MLKARRALLSVSDKRNLVDLARGLVRLGVELVSTGGTFKALDAEGIPVLRVSEVTGFPEILDGRVKTLHPAIHGGILADRGRASHAAALHEHGIQPIDIVVVNLYPFAETAARDKVTDQEIIDQIDIGGPSMVRAAAKNHDGVVVVVDPDDYTQVLAALEEGEGQVPEALRRQLALKAFRHTQAYDAAIADWMERREAGGAETFPHHFLVDLERDFVPRYGENPHQRAAVYRTLGGPGVLGGMEKLQGKDLSWNNLLDADAARRLVALFEEPTVVILKHGNPCGVGRGPDLSAAFERALACDRMSAFGSIVAVNRPVEEALPEAMQELFVEVLLAPEVTAAARQRLTSKPNLRVLVCPPFGNRGGSRFELRNIDGGFLAQTPDTELDDPGAWTCATRRQPTDEQRIALEFAWTVVRQVRSNAIVIANRDQTVGIGAGQMSRVDACRLAIQKAELDLAGTVAASDAFFPFADGVEALAKAGVEAVVQPGGSKRDSEVVEAADKLGLAMLLTGTRHFLH